MINFEELTQQNHKIAELSKLLSLVIEDRSMCDADVTCDLFLDFATRVQEHLDLEERELYQALLIHSEHSVTNTAHRFLSGSNAIKLVFKEYLKRWCHNKSLRIYDHDVFISDTNEMFELILQRIQDETEHFYPTVREVALEMQQAA